MTAFAVAALRAAALALPLLAPPALAQDPRALQERKCTAYTRAWSEALSRFGTAGLSADFLARHEAFLASGCRDRRVCPRSPEELDLANALTIAAMNDRMASSFVPFTCRE